MNGAPASIGTDLHARCDALYARRPSWVTGTISHFDARYLFARALAAAPGPVVEVGTASGLSTAVLCTALELAGHERGAAGGARLFTYDISTRFFADRSKRTGDAAREMLPAELLDQIVFRNPATASDLLADHGADAIGLMFIDADHRHPWPTLDLLAALDCLRPGAEVILHDVNLPTRRVESQQWGAKHVFDELDVDKQLDDGDPMPNIGSCRVPADKEILREQLLELMYAHPWEDDIDAEQVAAVLTKAETR